MTLELLMHFNFEHFKTVFPDIIEVSRHLLMEKGSVWLYSPALFSGVGFVVFAGLSEALCGHIVRPR